MEENDQNSLVPWIIANPEAAARTIIEQQKEAKHDMLTGALNKTSIMEVARTHLIRSQRNATNPGNTNFFIWMVDADNFKEVNDKWGHLTGDSVLKAITQALKKSLREGELFGRYGGDEWLGYLVDADNSVMEKVRNRIDENIKNHCKELLEQNLIGNYNFEEISNAVGVSMGFSKAELSNKNETIENLIKKADENLQKVKKNKKVGR